MIESILIDHVLRCKGENIKIIVADNASVGKSLVTCIALPQYVVDQGLALLCRVVYLENNHGKFLCNMLFGQFQTKRRRTGIVVIYGLLSEFETVRKTKVTVCGYAVNPLGFTEFVKMFENLGYETPPPHIYIISLYSP